MTSTKIESQEYFNFINSLDSEYTKKEFSYWLELFLQYCKLDLTSFLKLPSQEITDLIIKYLVHKKGFNLFFKKGYTHLMNQFLAITIYGNNAIDAEK